MWIHEGWATYLECLFVEYMYGHADYLAYVNAEKNEGAEHRADRHGARHPSRADAGHVSSRARCSSTRCEASSTTTARGSTLIHDFFRRFKCTDDPHRGCRRVLQSADRHEPHADLQRVLRHADVPLLELTFDEQAHTVAYRWRAGEKDFAMPVRVGNASRAGSSFARRSEWQTMSWEGKRTDFEVATDLYYVYVDRGARVFGPVAS
mgnify:CR=1 FL=1